MNIHQETSFCLVIVQKLADNVSGGKKDNHVTKALQFPMKVIFVTLSEFHLLTFLKKKFY